MDIVVRNKDIADRYRDGENAKAIMNSHPDVTYTEFYGALREHNVPKRGRGSFLKNQWKQARETGVLPPALAKAHAGRTAPTIAKPSKAKKTSTSKVATVKTPVDNLAMTAGMKTIGALVATGAITEDDVKRMASAFTIVPLKTATKPAPKKKYERSPEFQAKFEEVVKRHKKGMTQTDISLIVGLGLSTVNRYIAEYRLSK